MGKRRITSLGRTALSVGRHCPGQVLSDLEFETNLSLGGNLGRDSVCQNCDGWQETTRVCSYKIGIVLRLPDCPPNGFVTPGPRLFTQPQNYRERFRALKRRRITIRLKAILSRTVRLSFSSRSPRGKVFAPCGASAASSFLQHDATSEDVSAQQDKDSGRFLAAETILPPKWPTLPSSSSGRCGRR